MRSIVIIVLFFFPSIALHVPLFFAMLSTSPGWSDCRENAFCHMRERNRERNPSARRLDSTRQRQVVKLRQRLSSQRSELSPVPAYLVVPRQGIRRPLTGIRTICHVMSQDEPTSKSAPVEITEGLSRSLCRGCIASVLYICR